MKTAIVEIHKEAPGVPIVRSVHLTGADGTITATISLEDFHTLYLAALGNPATIMTRAKMAKRSEAALQEVIMDMQAAGASVV